jgi:tubulin polyglutamylase TTLL6/13
LVTSCDPLRIYLHQDGLVRFATDEYHEVSMKNKDNKFMHLTNFAINKNSSKFKSGLTSDGD